MMKIAFFTPVSPQKTGISDYAEQEILPYLSQFCEIDIFIDKNIRPSNQALVKEFDIFPYTDFPLREKKYDVPVYQMGNNPMHTFVYDTLMEYPGIVVLHDIYLHGFLWNTSLVTGDRQKYLEMFEYCYGKKGVTVAQTALATGVYPEFEYPLIKKIIDRSLGVLCHSEFGVTQVIKEHGESMVKKINQPYNLPENTKEIPDPSSLKAELHLSGFFPVITSFGYIFSHKRYHVIIRTFKNFLQQYPRAKLVLVGEDMMNLNRMIADAGLSDSVIQTGFVSHSRAQQYLDISDFCINLRYPTAGETSRSVLQLMASRKPVIVSNVGWFAELPDNACLKVDVDRFEEEMLLEYMIALSSDSKFRNAIGLNAYDYIVRHHEVVSLYCCKISGHSIQRDHLILHR
jgi:glycosyltransferase involved in cell wall biosynthesis